MSKIIVNHTILYGLINFKFKIENIDKLYLKIIPLNNLSKSVIHDITGTKCSLANLDPDSFYKIEIWGEYNKYKSDVIIINNAKPNIKSEPDKPKFIIDDTSHNIIITLCETNTYGIPIDKILIYYNNNDIPEIHDFISWTNQLTLKKQIHSETKINIIYQNQFGMKSTKSKSQIIKKIPCGKIDFSMDTKLKTLVRSQYKCLITDIPFDEKYNRHSFIYKDNCECNNSYDNCQAILVEMEEIKKNNPTYYQSLFTDKTEVLRWKINKMKILQDLLNTSISNRFNTK